MYCKIQIFVKKRERQWRKNVRFPGDFFYFVVDYHLLILDGFHLFVKTIFFPLKLNFIQKKLSTTVRSSWFQLHFFFAFSLNVCFTRHKWIQKNRPFNCLVSQCSHFTILYSSEPTISDTIFCNFSEEKMRWYKSRPDYFFTHFFMINFMRMPQICVRTLKRGKNIDYYHHYNAFAKYLLRRIASWIFKKKREKCGWRWRCRICHTEKFNLQINIYLNVQQRWSCVKSHKFYPPPNEWTTEWMNESCVTHYRLHRCYALTRFWVKDAVDITLLYKCINIHTAFVRQYIEVCQIAVKIRLSDNGCASASTKDKNNTVCSTYKAAWFLD